MRKFFLLLVMFSVALGGCGDVEWLPEQGVSQFSFDSADDVSPGTVVTSNTIDVETPNASETIRITGGDYSINGGEFTSDAGTVEDGDQVTVRHQAASEAGGVVETRLTIGDKSATFRSTAGTPVVFDQPAIFNATPATVTTSSAETVIVSGDSAPISITGGSYSLDGGAFVTDAGTVNDGQTVRVRHTTAAAGTTGAAATTITVLTIGQMKSTFTTSVTGEVTETVNIVTPGDIPEVIAELRSLVSGSYRIRVRESSKLGAFSLDRRGPFVTETQATLRAGQIFYFQETAYPSMTEIIIADAQERVVQRIFVNVTLQP